MAIDYTGLPDKSKPTPKLNYSNLPDKLDYADLPDKRPSKPLFKSSFISQPKVTTQRNMPLGMPQPTRETFLSPAKPISPLRGSRLPLNDYADRQRLPSVEEDKQIQASYSAKQQAEFEKKYPEAYRAERGNDKQMLANDIALLALGVVSPRTMLRGVGLAKNIGKFVTQGKSPAVMERELAELQSKLFSKPYEVKQIVKSVIDHSPETTDTGRAVNSVVNALKQAKPLRQLQEETYHRIRVQQNAEMAAIPKNITGMDRVIEQKKILAKYGSMPKVNFEPIAISPQDRKVLDKMIVSSDLPGQFSKMNATIALDKLFGQYGGRVPQEGELKLLRQVFGENLVKELMDKRPLLSKMASAGYQLASLPRSLMAGFGDMSFAFRQGAFLTHKPYFWQDFGKMVRAYKSPKFFEQTQKEIYDNPLFDLANTSRVSFTDIGETLGSREEQFKSILAEKIPGIGIGVRAANRAYTTMGNKLRMDAFSDLYKQYKNLGIDLQNHPDEAKKVADYVNAATGRASLGMFEGAADALNVGIFSPRLIASRLKMLSIPFDPRTYITMNPILRKEAFRNLFSYAALRGTLAGLAKLGGAEVVLDPRSSDFMKIKIGNTRLDPWGGAQQYVVLASRLLTGKIVSSTTGKEYSLGVGYKPLTRYDITLRSLESKASPLASLAVGMLRGRDITGKPFNVAPEIGKRFVPMIISDVYDLAKEDPKLIPLAIPSAFGLGVQTYK